jgi:galactose mutarotase-like enzyme
MYFLENDHIKIAVREQGGEMTSIFDKKNKVEHLWQADPAIWPWHAPTLFPVVGRCLNDQITINGESYPMPQHGFVRRSDFVLAGQHDDLLHLRLSASDKTFPFYPYLFDFHTFYEIKSNYLIITYEVENTGKDTMYFQLGTHPGFAVPFLPGEVYEDYYIEFEKDIVLDRENLNKEGYV